MRIGMRLGVNEAVQCTTIVEVILYERRRHPLDADDRGAIGCVVTSE